MWYENAPACSSGRQCTCHSSLAGKLGRYGSLHKTGKQVSVTFACVCTSSISVKQQEVKGNREKGGGMMKERRNHINMLNVNWKLYIY